MTNRHNFPFQFSFGRSNHERVDLQSVIGELQNFARPMSDRAQRQSSVNLQPFIRLQQLPNGSNADNREISHELSNDIASDIIIDFSGGTDNGGPQPESLRTQQNNSSQAPRVQTNPIAGLNILLEQNPDISRALRIFLTCVPFLILILLKELYEHATDILVTTGLVITFVHSNNTIERQVSKQGKREIKRLGIVLFNCTACILFVYLIYGEREFHRNLLLYPRAPAVPVSFLSLLWTNITTDYVLKLMTVLVKAILAAYPSSLIPFLRRGKYFVFTEMSSQLYRALATVPPWIHYLYNDHQNVASNESVSSELIFWNRFVGTILVVMYLICKAYRTVTVVKAWKTSLGKVFQSTNYGSSPSAEQLESVGTICPICHDEFKRPTCLQCRHIFCEDCVALWLDRERTCPMCRATVAEDPKWKDGSTDPFIQLF